MQTGLGLGHTTAVLNEWRKAQTPTLRPVSFSCVQRFLHKSKVIDLSTRATEKSGDNRPESNWAKARLAQCMQWKKQLGPLDAGGDLPPIHLDGIAFWDEHHEKIRLGHASKYEVRICRDENGKPATEQTGGKFPPKKPTTTSKNPGEARGCFGACMVTKVDSETQEPRKEGIRLTPFNYTGKTVVGPKKWRLLVDAEKLRGRNPVLYVNSWTYEERFPNEEERDAAIKEALGKPCTGRSIAYVDVRDIMSHVVAVSKAAYAGAARQDDFMIFHDGLTAWWEPEAQQHMEKLGMRDRQLRALHDTNKNTRYAGKLVGNSPELCRALDSHGFADLKAAAIRNASVDSRRPVHERRFNLGTPDNLWSTLVLTWEHAPSSARIIEDIEALPMVLDQIIEAQGCVVEDENLRSGRRAIYMRQDNKRKNGGKTEHKPRNRQRIATNKGADVHSSLQSEMDRLAGKESV